MWRPTAPRQLSPQAPGLPARDSSRVCVTVELLLPSLPAAHHVAFGSIPGATRLSGARHGAGRLASCRAERFSPRAFQVRQYLVAHVAALARLVAATVCWHSPVASTPRALHAARGNRLAACQSAGTVFRHWPCGARAPARIPLTDHGQADHLACWELNTRRTCQWSAPARLCRLVFLL